MSQFERGLEFFKQTQKQLKKVDEEPIEESLEENKQETLESIKQEARQKASEAASKTEEDLLHKFKTFIQGTRKKLLIEQCEKQDPSKLGFISFMGFLRSLKHMGFRLLFDQYKTLVKVLGVFDEERDRVFYYKLISNALRKLYRREAPVPKTISQTDAALTIVRVFRMLRKKKHPETPKVDLQQVIQAIVQKVQESPKSLLETFKEIDKDQNGFLEQQEVTELVHNLGTNLKPEEAKQVFQAIDSNSSGKISFEELAELMRKHQVPEQSIVGSLTKQDKSSAAKSLLSEIQKAISDSELPIEEVFKIFGEEPKPKFNLDEFFQVVQKVGLQFSRFDVNQVFSYIDTSNSGFLSLEEFKKLFFKKKQTPTDALKLKEKQQFLEETKTLEPQDTPKKPSLKQQVKFNIQKTQKETQQTQKETQQTQQTQKETQQKLIEQKPKELNKPKPVSRTLAPKKLPSPKPPQKPAQPPKNAKTSKKPQKPSEESLFIKNEVIPLIIDSVIQKGESNIQAKRLQKKYEQREVKKQIFVHTKDWEQQTSSSAGIWSCQALGRLGYLESQAHLKQLDLLTGEPFQSAFVGTRPPLLDIPIITSVCDQENCRFFTLNEQWILEAWDLSKDLKTPYSRVEVTQGPLENCSKLLRVSKEGKVLVNSTCADGHIHCLDPNSLSTLWKTKFTTLELELPQAVLEGLDQFILMLEECARVGISEMQAFELLDFNGDGVLSYEELEKGIRDMNLKLTKDQIKGVFHAIDKDNSGRVSLDEFWNALYMRKHLVLAKEAQEKTLLKLPDWASEIGGQTKNSLYKLFKALEHKGYTASQLFSVFDSDNSGFITATEFQKVVFQLLDPFVSQTDVESILSIADKDRNGYINYKEFESLIAIKRSSLMEDSVTLNSSNYPKHSLSYVVHKVLELGIDLLKLCKQLDEVNLGSLSKDDLGSMLLSLPIGLRVQDLEPIFQAEVSYDNLGFVNYLEIFENETYKELVRQAQKPGFSFLTPELKQDSAVVEDFVLLEELNLIAYTTKNPTTSVIFIKTLQGKLLAKLPGHWNLHPPILHYVSSANVLLSGEKRIDNSQPKDIPTCSEPPCEVLVWNLQKDLVDKFNAMPPWTVRPFKKVYAHFGSILDITYLPLCQVVVTTGSDSKVKLWNPTGTPYALVKSSRSQTTQTNQFFSEVATLDLECSELTVVTYQKTEWLVCLSESKVSVFGVQRFNLHLPAEQHDWPLPPEVLEEASELLNKYRQKALEEYKNNIPGFSKTLNYKKDTYQNSVLDIGEVMKKCAILDSDSSKVSQALKNLAQLGGEEEVTAESFYGTLVEYGMLKGCSYPQFVKILENLEVKFRYNPVTYPHQLASKLVSQIQEKSINIETELKKLELEGTGLVHKTQLKNLLEKLCSEEELKETLEQLDPFCTGKVEITKVTEMLSQDTLAKKLKSLAQPSELVNALRCAILPGNASKLHYTFIELDGNSTNKLTQQQFKEGFAKCNIQLDPEVLDLAYEFLKDQEGLVSIPFFVKEIFSGPVSKEIDEIEKSLTELKARLTYLRHPLDLFFCENSVTLEAIPSAKFIQKAQNTGVESNLEKTAAFLSMPSAKSPVVYRVHFLKHLNRLPTSFKYSPVHKPSKDYLRKFIKSKLLGAKDHFKEVLQEFTSEDGTISPPYFRLLLEKYYNIPGQSAIVDSLLKEAMDSQTLHTSQLVNNLTELAQKPHKEKSKIPQKVRKTLENYCLQNSLDPNQLASSIFETWNSQSKLSERVIDIHDFVNSLRIHLPVLEPKLLSNLVLEGPTIDFKEFTAEAFTGFTGIKDQTIVKESQENLKEVVESTLKRIAVALRNSSVSLDRAFQLFDTDKDGYISAYEFKKVFGLLDLSVDDNQVQALLQRFDKNQNGLVSYEEFVDTVFSYSSLTKGQTLAHWEEALSSSASELLKRFKPLVPMFRRKCLSLQTKNEQISLTQFTDIMYSISDFSQQEIQTLCEFSVEGSKKEQVEHLLPSQLGAQSASVSYSNQRINFLGLCNAVIEFSKAPSDSKGPNTSKSEFKNTPSQLATFAFLQREKAAFEFQPKIKTYEKEVEKELFEYLSFKMNQKSISLSKLFQEIDTDGSGMISREEMGTFLEKIGYSLSSSELSTIMKALDKNSDQEVSYKELKEKLIGYGYQEPWKLETYVHEWNDQALCEFFKNFNSESFEELLVLLDANKDGTLTMQELRTALLSVSKFQADRVLNLLFATSKRDLSVSFVLKSLQDLQKELPKSLSKSTLSKLGSNQGEVVKLYNPLSQLTQVVQNLAQLSLVLSNTAHTAKKKRGLELFTAQNRAIEALGIMRTGVVRFRTLLDYLKVFALEEILREAKVSMILPNYDLIPEFLDVSEDTLPPQVQGDSFKVMWSSSRQVNSIYKECLGLTLPEQKEVKVVMYSSSALKETSADGNSIDNHLKVELVYQQFLQDRLPEISNCLGIHYKKVGYEENDYEVYVLYDEIPGVTFRELLRMNGGLLKIPVIYNTRAALYLAKFWGRQVLEILYKLHSHSRVLRVFDAESLVIAPDGGSLKLSSLRGSGQISSSGQIVSAPDLKFLFSENVKSNAYLAPEYFLEKHQTAAVDVWSFGALLYNLLFGVPPPTVFEQSSKENLDPFPYYIYEGFKVENGQAVSDSNSDISLIECTNLCSFSGLVKDQLESREKFETDHLHDVYERILSTQHLSNKPKNDLGLLLDLIALCLQVNPDKRPTVKGLLNCSLFQLDKYETTQAKRFAGLVFNYRSPEIAVSKPITQPLVSICQNLHLDNSDYTLDIVEYLNSVIVQTSTVPDTLKPTTKLLTGTFTESQKDALLKEALNSPISDLLKQVIQDEVLDMLVFLSLNYFEKGDKRLLQAFLEFLSNCMYEMYSYSSPLAPQVSYFIETLLKLFVGEEKQLASSQFSPKEPKPYILRKSFWNPELFEMVSGLYKDTIAETGLGQHYYPVIKEFVGTTRHPDYFSELLGLAENLVVLRKQEGTTAKKNSLVHLRTMLQTRNQHKIQAALDFRLPQHLLPCLSHSDPKVRSEALAIMWEISKGCCEQKLPPINDVYEQHRANSILNFFSVAKHETHETTKDFKKYANSANTPQVKALNELATCFENPLFIVPVVRLLKFKTEPFENKETAARILVSVLQGSEQSQLAALSPATDTVSTLCKCLVTATRTTDKKSSNTLSSRLKPLVEELLVQAPPRILKAFKVTPGTKALLKEQSLEIPDPPTLPGILARLPSTYDINTDIKPLADCLQSWLKHVYRQSGVRHSVASAGVCKILAEFKVVTNIMWGAAEETQGVYSRVQKEHARGQISCVLELLEWMIYSELDFLWLRVEENVEWVVGIASRALEASRADYEFFPLSFEGLQAQRVVCRLLGKKGGIKVLKKLNWGKVLAHQMMLQFYRLREVISKNTEPLHVLQIYSAQSEVRIASFAGLLKSKKLQKQFLETEFLENLVGDFLTDMKVLDAKHNKLSLDFLAFRECCPLRGEAIALIESVLRSKNHCKDLYDDLLLQFHKHRTVEAEVINAGSKKVVIQATALELLSLFIESNETQLNYLLLQFSSAEKLKETLEAEPLLGLRFPVVQKYIYRSS